MSDIDRASDRSNSDAENLIFTIVDDGGSEQQQQHKQIYIKKTTIRVVRMQIAMHRPNQ